MKTLPEIQDASLEYAKIKGFDLDETQPGTKLMLITSEAAEALESIRNNEPVLWYQPDGKPEGLGPELADIILRTCQMAAHHGINLEEMVNLKHDYNMTRALKHGGKAF